MPPASLPRQNLWALRVMQVLYITQLHQRHQHWVVDRGLRWVVLGRVGSGATSGFRLRQEKTTHVPQNQHTSRKTGPIRSQLLARAGSPRTGQLRSSCAAPSERMATGRSSFPRVATCSAFEGPQPEIALSNFRFCPVQTHRIPIEMAGIEVQPRPGVNPRSTSGPGATEREGARLKGSEGWANFWSQTPRFVEIVAEICGKSC